MSKASELLLSCCESHKLRDIVYISNDKTKYTLTSYEVISGSKRYYFCAVNGDPYDDELIFNSEKDAIQDAKDHIENGDYT